MILKFFIYPINEFSLKLLIGQAVETFIYVPGTSLVVRREARKVRLLLAIKSTLVAVVAGMEDLVMGNLRQGNSGPGEGLKQSEFNFLIIQTASTA